MSRRLKEPLVRLGRLRSPLRLLSVAVLAVVVGSTVAGFFVTRSVVNDEQHRLVRDRAEQVGLLIQSLFGPVVSALPQLASSDVTQPGVHPQFVAQARGYLGTVDAIGALRFGDGGFTSTVSVGAGVPPGAEAGADLASLAARAMASKGEVDGLVTTSKGRRLSLALSAGSGVVVYEDLAFDPSKPLQLSALGPFSDLDGAVYASNRPDPQALVVTTNAHLSLSGDTSAQTVPVGQQHWLVVVKSRGSLVGALAAKAPWALLIGGLLAATLATLLVETLARRRSYALALVDERTTALRRAESAERQARRAAEAANQAKSEFLSRMSHELRTPLNAIIGFGQLLELDDINADQQDSVNQILKGGRHLLDLINEVLDISRIETGNLPLSPEAVSVADATADVVELMRPLADEREVNLSMQASPDRRALHVLADRQRLKQILLNLLANAIKYNHRGGAVTVSVEHHNDQRCRIVITDTGPGITPDKMTRLFVPFERLGAEATGVEGTGVGLALSRRLAEAMNGTLEMTSTPGHGSQFWIELPTTEGPLERYERLHAPEPITGDQSEPSARRTVLYIEDNLSNLRLIERVLAQREDMQLLPAMQGRLGLTLAKEHQPAIILLDLHLPDLSGEQVLEQLRDDPTTATIPIVILSADATPGQIERLLAAGATSYLTKPVDIRQLLHVLDEQPISSQAT